MATSRPRRPRASALVSPGAVSIALAVAWAALSGCVPDPEAKTCDTGIYCPAGTKCAANQAVCLYDDCGDGELQPGELCDDGDVISGRLDATGQVISSGTCNADCSSDETCGNGYTDGPMGEACDDGNRESGDGCSADCLSREQCGDGVLDPGEECDTQGVPTAWCNPLTCKVSACGDAYVNALAGEDCDDANAVETDDCRTTCEWNVCGDGAVDQQGPVTEACDLAGGNGETVCEYGLTSCVGCTTACELKLDMVAHYCGDGVDDGTMEECDAAASFACGTCAPVACTIVEVHDAEGAVEVVSAAVADGDYLVISDGLGGAATLEFNTAGGCGMAGADCIAVASGDTVTDIASKVAGALVELVNAKMIAVSSTIGGSRLQLFNGQAGVAGNVPIVAGSVAGTAPPAFMVQGMSGGLGCPVGAACFASRDCVSNSCKDGTCRTR